MRGLTVADKPRRPRARRRVARAGSRRAVTVWTTLAAVCVVGVYGAVAASVVASAVAQTREPAPAGGVPHISAAPPSPAGPGDDDPIAVTGTAALVDQAWVRDQAGRTGIPVRALIGYAGATLQLGAENPGCHLEWTTLAALGAIESDHGRHAGARIDDDGVTRPGVWGPELDGKGNALIPDTDGGAIDGSAQYDRAVGPMQFIPDTWRRWGADATGQGTADPEQIDDASLAAARYLCSYGDLSDAATWREAIFGYNHLDVYVDNVARAANSYAELSRR